VRTVRVKNLGLLLDLAGLHASSDNAQEAFKVFEAILEKHPGVFQAVDNSAIFMLQQGSWEISSTQISW